MSKKDSIKLTGKVIECFPDSRFKVEFENNHTCTAYTGGRLKINKIKILEGDSVDVEFSPYDLTKGRIVRRN